MNDGEKSRSSFLKGLDFLSQDQREKLSLSGLDSPAAIDDLGRSELAKMLPERTAVKLLKEARRALLRSEIDDFWYKDEPNLSMCPQCGAFIAASSESCPVCGVDFEEGDEEEIEDGEEPSASLDEEIDGHWYKDEPNLFICPQCSSFVSMGSDKCPFCGVEFEEGEEETSGDEERPSVEIGDEDKDGFWYKDSDGLLVCPVCGGFISKYAEECPICGAEFEEDEEEVLAPEVSEKPLNPEIDGHWYRDEPDLFICPSCGSLVSLTASQCPNCGVEFEEGEEETLEEVTVPERAPDIDGHWYKEQKGLFLCPECGNLVPEDKPACPRCGVEFEDGEEGELPEVEKTEETDGYWYKTQGSLFMCPECGAFVLSSMENCPSCGADHGEEDEVEVRTCPLCNAFMDPTSEVCPVCGIDISEVVDVEEPEEWERATDTTVLEPERETKIQDKGFSLEFEEEEDLSPEDIRPDEEEKDDFTLRFFEEMQKEEKGEDEGQPEEETLDEERFPEIHAPEENFELKFLEEPDEEPLEKGEITPSEEYAEGPEAWEEGGPEEYAEDDMEDVVPSEEEKALIEGIEGPGGDRGKTSDESITEHESIWEARLICPTCGRENPESEERCRDCGDLLREGADYDEPEREKKSIISGFKKRWETIAGEEEKDIEDLLRQYDRLLEIDPTLTKVWESKAELLANKGDIEGACNCIEKAIELEPHREREFKKSVAEILSQRVFDEEEKDVDTEKVLGLYQELTKLEPRNPKVWQTLGEIHRNRGEDKEAERAFERSIELSLETDEQDHETALRRVDGMKILEEEAKPEKEVAGRARPSSLISRPGGLVNGLVNGRGRTNGIINGTAKKPDRGLVNGTRPSGERGLVNGSKKGRVNGLRPSGLVNGKGRTNGLVNGLVNGRGRTNGLVNGLVNGVGKINGLAGGQGRVKGRIREMMAERSAPDGLINGIGTVKEDEGLINGLGGHSKLGLVNGDGLVNGTGRFLRSHGPVSKGPNWTVRAVGIIALIAILIGAPLIATFIYTSDTTPGGLAVDGYFDDWQGIETFENLGPALRNDPSLDILQVQLTTDAGYLYVHMVTSAPLANIEHESEIHDVFVMIDRDWDEETGYDLNYAGAEQLFHIKITRRGVSSGELWFNGTNDRNDWYGFRPGGGSATVAVNGNHVEGRIDIGIQNTPRVMVMSHDSLGNTHVFHSPVSPGMSSLGAFAQWLHEDVSSGENDELMEVGLRSSSSIAKVESVHFRILGDHANVTDPRLSILDEDIAEYTEITNASSGRDHIFSFEPALEVEVTRSVAISLAADLSLQPETAFGVELTDVVLENGIASVWNPSGMSYWNRSPSLPVIDGAFGDWGNALEDREGDVSKENLTVYNGNADMVAYGVNKGELLSFYARVNGKMLGGEDVPVLLWQENRTGGGPSYRSPDKDRDGIPDIRDAYPRDFNNDGIPDDESFVTINGTAYRDVDDDGIPDHPQMTPTGLTDYWLENEYTGAKVYIGPLPKKTAFGTDRVVAHFDTDMDPSTGHNLEGRVGSEVMVIIEGRHGKVLSSTLYLYNPQKRPSPWNDMGPVDCTVRGDAIEAGFDSARAGMGPADDVNAVIIVEDWKGTWDWNDQPVSTFDQPQTTRPKPPPPPPDVTLDPDYTRYVQDNTTAIYNHTLTVGRAKQDRYNVELEIASSAGFNVSIYESGKLVATDIDGDGVWDYVNPAYDKDNDGNPDISMKGDEVIELQVYVEIPYNTTLNDTTTLTAFWDQDPSYSDSVTDMSIIPEYDLIFALMAAGTVVGAGYFHRKKKLGQERKGAEDFDSAQASHGKVVSGKTGGPE